MPPQRIHLPLYGQLKEHVSFSEIGLFNSCQWKWVLMKVFGIDSDERSLAMEFGSSAHSGMEFMYGESGIQPIPDAVTHALAELKKNLEGLELNDQEKEDLPGLQAMLPRFFEDMLSCEDLVGIRPLKSELRLYESIARTDGLDVKFKGFIDFIFVKRLKTKSVIYIADFKTCKWGWPYKKYQDIKVIAQILLYKHFFCKLTGADPKNVTAAFILLKKTPKEGESSVEVAKIASGPKALQQALDYLQKTITEMHSYSYTKNYESCVTRWTDAKTKKEMSFSCPYLRKECEGPPDTPPGTV